MIEAIISMLGIKSSKIDIAHPVSQCIDKFLSLSSSYWHGCHCNLVKSAGIFSCLQSVSAIWDWLLNFWLYYRESQSPEGEPVSFSMVLEGSSRSGHEACAAL